ncbi:MAG TPA: hypothetical protein VM847_14355, partial [Tahibacter sp.]|nr:hypothetical protein [Tahibacter sp.]
MKQKPSGEPQRHEFGATAHAEARMQIADVLVHRRGLLAETGGDSALGITAQKSEQDVTLDGTEQLVAAEQAAAHHQLAMQAAHAAGAATSASTSSTKAMACARAR